MLLAGVRPQDYATAEKDADALVAASAAGNGETQGGWEPEHSWHWRSKLRPRSLPTNMANCLPRLDQDRASFGAVGNLMIHPSAGYTLRVDARYAGSDRIDSIA